MTYKGFILYWLCFLSFGFGGAQKLNDDEMAKILDAYQAKLRQFVNFEDCGHALDGPAYFFKQAERSTLDALLYVSEEEEMEMGAKVFEEIKKNNTIKTDHWASKKVQQIMDKLLKNIERPGIDYSIYILESEQINAFATVGGYIYLTTSILDFVDSDDELAFIIAHEISHIDQYHTLRKQKKLLLASAFGEMMDLKGLTNIALNINLMLSAPFDQVDEYAADKNGAQLARDAGFDARRFGDFFDKLKKDQNKNILNKLLSTHPFAEDRKECMEKHLNE